MAALTPKKLSKISDTQLEQERQTAKYFIAMYEMKLKNRAFLNLYEQKQFTKNNEYYHDELGKVLREMFIRKNTK